ncbi:uncharacterized protein [Primulina eburnea]|uniref:uncharacterized protein n=1 Tax=Primulina eburnea TaxID=1245227 RepID=UPI003C6C96C3
MKNKKIFDFFKKKNDESASTGDLNEPNNASPFISEPASTKKPRLENETLNEPLPNITLQYVSDPGIRIPILQYPIELQDEVRREYIDKGPIQPIYDYPFAECEAQFDPFTVKGFKNWKRVSIESVKLLAMQGCAFRGHDESVDSKNRGHYIELINLLGRMNPEIGSILEKAAKMQSTHQRKFKERF